MLDVYVLSLSILDITTIFEMVYDFYVGCMVYSLLVGGVKHFFHNIWDNPSH